MSPLHRRRRRTSNTGTENVRPSTRRLRNLFCLWNVLSDLIALPPNGACRRFLGQLDSIRIYTMGTFVTAKMAGRRVLILEKIRHCAGESKITTALYAGISSSWRARSRPRTAVGAVPAAPHAAGWRFPCPPLAGSATAIHLENIVGRFCAI
jgi:hypothetical protein